MLRFLLISILSHPRSRSATISRSRGVSCMVSPWNQAFIFPPESKNAERPVEFDASCKGGGAGISERAGTALKITDTFEFALQNGNSLAALYDYFCKALRDSSASESPLAMAS